MSRVIQHYSSGNSLEIYRIARALVYCDESESTLSPRNLKRILLDLLMHGYSNCTVWTHPFFCLWLCKRVSTRQGSILVFTRLFSRVALLYCYHPINQSAIYPGFGHNSLCLNRATAASSSIFREISLFQPLGGLLLLVCILFT